MGMMSWIKPLTSREAYGLAFERKVHMWLYERRTIHAYDVNREMHEMLRVWCARGIEVGHSVETIAANFTTALLRQLEAGDHHEQDVARRIKAAILAEERALR